MTDETLAKHIANGLIETGVEGGTDNVCCSTAYDSLCVGCSSWEQGRGQYLLSMIDGADKFMSRPFSDLSNDEIGELSALLDSEQGVSAQVNLLAEDCLEYLYAVKEEGVTNPQCVIYCAMWMPTSIYCVCRCINYAKEDGVDVNDIDSLAEFFYNNYPDIAGCEDYREGYENRSDIQLEYVKGVEG